MYVCVFLSVDTLILCSAMYSQMTSGRLKKKTINDQKQNYSFARQVERAFWKKKIITSYTYFLLPKKRGGGSFNNTSEKYHSKTKLKSNGDRASPCFKPFLIGNMSDKFWTLLYVSVRHIFINLTSFLGIPNSIKILYKTSLLTES